jgi:outer membrane protein assembly factor BamB
LRSDGNLYAFNPYGPSNTPKWILQLGAGLNSYVNAPAIGSDGTVYVATGDGLLFAVTDDITTGAGAVLWQYPASDALGSFYASPAIGVDGTIYIPSSGGHIYAVNPVNGHQKWQYPKAGSPALGFIDSSPAIAADGTIYVGSQDNNLYAIKPDGTLKWKFMTVEAGNAGNIEAASPVIGPDGTIYIGNEGKESQNPGFLCAILDTGTQGTLKWRYQIPAPFFDPSGYYGISDTPAVDSNGVIYFGASDGQVYALVDNGVVAPPTVKWHTIVATTNPDDTWETRVRLAPPRP